MSRNVPRPNSWPTRDASNPINGIATVPGMGAVNPHSKTLAVLFRLAWLRLDGFHCSFLVMRFVNELPGTPIGFAPNRPPKKDPLAPPDAGKPSSNIVASVPQAGRWDSQQAGEATEKKQVVLLKKKESNTKTMVLLLVSP